MSTAKRPPLNPYTLGRLQLSAFLVLAWVARAKRRNDRRSATKSAADELGITAFTRVTDSLESLERYFGDDLQLRGQTGERRTGTLTTKGRSLAAAAGVLQFYLEAILDPNADHQALLDHLNAQANQLQKLPESTFQRTPSVPENY